MYRVGGIYFPFTKKSCLLLCDAIVFPCVKFLRLHATDMRGNTLYSVYMLQGRFCGNILHLGSELKL
jgi:hypothetical protein